jgi:uncharacterized FlgJ-related protein
MWRMLLAVLAAVLLLWLIVSRIARSRSDKEKNPAQIIFEVLTKEGSLDEKTAQMWVAVARHETGNFTSALFRDFNNAFGMGQPSERLTLSLGGTPRKYEGQNMATFATVRDSALDILLYMRARKYPTRFATPTGLVSFMKSKGYFKDSLQNYSAGVNRYYYSENLRP